MNDKIKKLHENDTKNRNKGNEGCKQLYGGYIIGNGP